VTDISPLLPRQPVPPLAFALAGGGHFDLSPERPARFTLLVFFRGLHCPQCRNRLKDLESKLAEFEKRGVGVVAVSSDDAGRADRTKREWALTNLRLGYGIGLRVAPAWGLFISAGRGKTSVGVEEPALFSEPGLFLVRADGTLYFASVQTMPFARPHFADILTALDSVVAKDYPARGEIVSLPAQAAE
jgi:peroxiredoxin